MNRNIIRRLFLINCLLLLLLLLLINLIKELLHVLVTLITITVWEIQVIVIIIEPFFIVSFIVCCGRWLLVYWRITGCGWNWLLFCRPSYTVVCSWPTLFFIIVGCCTPRSYYRLSGWVDLLLQVRFLSESGKHARNIEVFLVLNVLQWKIAVPLRPLE